MSMIAESQLTDALQSLVDARLDTIDRMLLGRVNRADRLAIVREVESQIFDLLQGRDASALDRDDVLAVLARLDPPEAYLPDEGEAAEGRPTRSPSTSRAFAPGSNARPAPAARLDLAGGVLGIISVVLTMLSFPAAFIVGELILGMIPLLFILSLLAVVFSAKVRLRGGWALTGMVTGVMTLLATIAGGGFILMELLAEGL